MNEYDENFLDRLIIDTPISFVKQEFEISLSEKLIDRTNLTFDDR